MCGIAGIVELSAATVDREVLTRMTETLAHRGPESQGIWISGGVGLGHRRLAIIDPSNGAQPMHSQSGRHVITFNGEIFNYQELQVELARAGRPPRTGSDTEVLLEAFELWGCSVFERLNGQFALAIYDTEARALYCARDRMGEKPLYTARLGSTFLFGSELKALFSFAEHGGKSQKFTLDVTSLGDFLALNYVPRGNTLCREITDLPAGTWMKITHHGEVTRGTFAPLLIPIIDSDPVAQFEDLLDHSLKLRLRSDVPLGIFLSGGVDSSVVLCGLHNRQAAVRCFIADFQENSFSERAAARAAATACGMESEVLKIEVGVAEVRNLVAHLVHHGDTPLGDSSALNVFLLSKATKPHATVVLSGDGGDELFAGYLTYTATAVARKLSCAPVALRRIAAQLHTLVPASSSKVSFAEKAERFLRSIALSAGAAHFAWNGMFQLEEKRALLSPRFRAQITTETFDALAQESFLDVRKPRHHELLFADQQGYLRNDILAKVDRFTMAHSVEARPVLLDPHIVAFARALATSPKHQKLIHDKRLLKIYLERKAPWFNQKSPKRGFSIPIHQWFRGELGIFAREVFSASSVQSLGVFEVSELHRLLDLHQANKRSLGFELWGLLILCLYLDKWRRVISF